MKYRCEATSVAGFVQQVAVSYVSNGYFFYVAGRVPDGKAPEAVDAKIIDKYGIGVSKWAKARRKQAGVANLQYIRYERFFLILITHGNHAIFEEEAKVLRDVRRIPIRFAGYSISFRGGHVSVRIEPVEYGMLKAYLVGLATSRSAEHLAGEFRRIAFEPYAPVRRQLLNIFRAVNRRRREAGFETLPHSILRLRRRVSQPFRQSPCHSTPEKREESCYSLGAEPLR
jgi:hypothetical protein